MNTQRIRLDLDKSLAAGQIVVLGQGDKEGTTIEAEVFDNGVSANLAGMTASFRMRLPDGTSYYDESAEVSGNVVSVTVDETYAASVHGYTDDAYFTLTDDDRTYSTARFRIKVLRSADDDAVLPEPYINRVEEAIENANEAAEDAREAAGGVTPLMSELVRGGAKLGDGLAITGEALGVSPITTAQIDTIAGGGSVTSENVLTGTRLTYLWAKLKAGFASLVDGVVSVAQGGTGKGSHTSNSVLVGDGTNAVKNVASASGALYATAANGAPQFGTLPVAQGGTGATTAALARTNIDAAQSNGASGTLKAAEDEIDALEASLAYVESTTATANHAIGDYFMLGNVLMKATAAIATGETINASKATPATVQSQIDTLRDSVAQASYTPTVAVGTGVTLHGISALRFGPIVLLRVAFTPPANMDNGFTIMTLSNMPNPRTMQFMVCGSGEHSAAAMLNTDLTIVSAGVFSGGSRWLNATVAYFV